MTPRQNQFLSLGLGALALAALLLWAVYSSACAPLWAFAVVPPGMIETAPTPEKDVHGWSLDSEAGEPVDPNRFVSPFMIDLNGNILIRGEVEGVYGAHAIKATWKDRMSESCNRSVVTLATASRAKGYSVICLMVAPEILLLMRGPEQEDVPH